MTVASSYLFIYNRNMKGKEKNIAVRLRKNGASYGEILKSVNVSRGTLSAWLRDIELAPTQLKKLLKGREISRYASGKKKKYIREQKTLKIIELAKKEFGSMAKNSLFLIGLSLYWAEGDKHKQERIKFTNSDPILVALILRWFREICDVPESKFRVALHIHNLHVSPEVQKYWRKITGVPTDQFQKIYVKHSTLKYRRNVLYNGTCAIVVNNKDLFRRIVGWKQAMTEQFAATPS